MKHIFRDSNLLKVKDVTNIRPLTAEEQKLEEEAKEEEAKRPPTDEGKGKGKGASSNAPASQLNSYKGPNHEKFVPNCISVRTSPLSTSSDLLDYIRYSATLSEENRFSLIFDDQVNDEI